MTDRLVEIETRAEASTPGPWKLQKDTTGTYIWADSETTPNGLPPLVVRDEHLFTGNAEFIAHAREDISWLLAYVTRLAEERETLLRANEMVAGAFSDEVSVREISMKMVGNALEGHAVFADDAHPAIKILAAAALSLLELDGTVPENYRTASLHGRLRDNEGEYFLEIASCRSADQTPHNLRMRAEAKVGAARAEALAEVVAKLERIHSQVTAFADEPSGLCENCHTYWPCATITAVRAMGESL